MSLHFYTIKWMKDTFHEIQNAFREIADIILLSLRDILNSKQVIILFVILRRNR